MTGKNCCGRAKKADGGKCDKSVKTAAFRQYYAALTVNILTLCNGITAGWTSPVQAIFKSKDNPLSPEPLSDDTFSWATSVLYIGGFLGILLWNKTADILGRKINGYLLASTQVIGWLGIIYASSPTHLIIARFVLGTGGCGAIINSQLYINETASEERKGPLSSLILMSMNIGFLMIFLLGSCLPYNTLNIVCFYIAVLYLLMFVWLPESPFYLLMKKDFNKAKCSMLWFRNSESEALEDTSDLQRILTDSENKKASYKELISSKYIRRTMIAVFLLMAQQLSGIGIVLSYTVKLFKISGTSISPYLSMFIVGCTQCITAFLSGLFVNNFGRKTLLMVSYVGAFFSFIVLYGFMLVKSEDDTFLFKLLPTGCILMFILFFNVGIGPIPFVMYPEMFPATILNHASCVCSLGLMLSAFVLTKVFPYLTVWFGETGIFLFFALCNLSLVLFVLVFVQETRKTSKGGSRIERNISIN